jgi:phage/plasmid-like protein (TIGR03299 family)
LKIKRGKVKMAHMVETMFWSGREVPWHGLGKQVIEAPDSREAIKHAGLEWEVIRQPMFTTHNSELVAVPGTFANVRSTDGKVLGVVKSAYKIVQNSDAFDFVDGIIGGDVRYETAGSLHGGRKIWLLAKLPATQIMGDEVVPYLCFTNSHDGQSAIRAALTPVRVVCQNTLNVALSGATRMWIARHKGDLAGKMEEAQRILKLAGVYMNRLQEDAQILVAKPISDKQAIQIYESLIFPDDVNTLTERQFIALKGRMDDLKLRYFSAPDLDRLRGTAWGVFSAVTDFVTHAQPLRKTASYRDNLMEGAIDGYDLVNEAHQILMAA